MQKHDFPPRVVEPPKIETILEQAKILKGYFILLAKSQFYGTIELRFENGIVQLVDNHSGMKMSAIAKMVEGVQ